MDKGTPGKSEFGKGELESAMQLKKVVETYVVELGGTLCSESNDEAKSANYVVFYQPHADKSILNSYQKDQKVIQYTYVTECYFQMLRLKAQDFQVKENK